MPVAVALVAVSAAATVAQTVVSVNAANSAARDSKSAANQAAADTQAVAGYNARVDRANEEQVALDSKANIDAMRKDASVYLSRQRASFAGAGVMADSGSPLAVQVATAGQLALREQQAHTAANAEMQRIESSAKAGIASGDSQAAAYKIEGDARARAYHAEATGAILGGAAKLFGTAAGAYNAGMFGTGTSDLSSSLNAGATGASDLPSINAGAIA